MALLRFSTDQVPVEQRRDVVEAAYGAHVSGAIDFLDEAPVRAAMVLRDVANIHIARLETPPVQITTSPDDDGTLYLSITQAGGGVIDARGAERQVHSGDINVLRRERRCVTIAAEPSHLLNIAIPKAVLVPRLRAGTDSLLPTHSLASPVARLLQGYAMTLLMDERAITPAEEALFSAHIIDLAALLLGPGRDAAEQAKQQGVRAARRQAIKADVAVHLSEPELSLDWIARRHGLSVPYIRALFYDEGSSFTDHVMHARLDHVRALLLDPKLSGRTIAALALMAGFGDISWFNQVFRRRFGMTPSDMRASKPGDPVSQNP
ncbi:hypothetical protein BBF93_10305 [Hyphomonas sp. CACIAM 19H1]|uniref:helix-turn-helix domain-containing protein n=1 Tax=Hyphomonas sp. CACIAM 19H1 TaxID=1873716 RepID=UPI000DED747E|nr:helix-turn-helix domain-containing protein [Hyphomonas sp. CACIAM 19H1]AXE64578.1 hypothetical protein BBF93_10305 [Hyphomonas sp. CACIAM 19H1]